MEEAADRPELDLVFMRKKFLLRQKHLAISEKYYVWDEGGKVILFIQRPAHLVRGCLAALGGIAAGAVVGAGLFGLSSLLPEEARSIGIMVAVFAGLAALLLTIIQLMPKRHVYFYRDDTKREMLLQVDQDQKFAVLVATYTVKDPAGKVLARLRKNYLYNLIRKKWQCYAPDGTLLATIKEDSLILALVRRFVAAFKTNFVILKGDTDQQIGQFNRKWTILDRYVLDMTADTGDHLDLRVALAIGVMLDTGERR